MLKVPLIDGLMMTGRFKFKALISSAKNSGLSDSFINFLSNSVFPKPATEKVYSDVLLHCCSSFQNINILTQSHKIHPAIQEFKKQYMANVTQYFHFLYGQSQDLWLPTVELFAFTHLVQSIFIQTESECRKNPNPVDTGKSAIFTVIFGVVCKRKIIVQQHKSIIWI